MPLLDTQSDRLLQRQSVSAGTCSDLLLLLIQVIHCRTRVTTHTKSVKSLPFKFMEETSWTVQKGACIKRPLLLMGHVETCMHNIWMEQKVDLDSLCWATCRLWVTSHPWGSMCGLWSQGSQIHPWYSWSHD